MTGRRQKMQPRHEPEVRWANQRKRLHDLINTIFDGTRPGRSLYPETVVELLHEHWAPHFDKAVLAAEVEYVLQNRRDPLGCGPKPSGEQHDRGKS